MAKQVINNGAFDNDPSAEKVRLAFGKVNANFTEIYDAIPIDPAELVGQAGKILVINPGEDGYAIAAAPGGGDMLSANNLNDVANVSQARINLGLGTAAVRNLVDEDNMVSNSDTLIPSQQSVKAYVDNSIPAFTAGAGIELVGGTAITNTSLADNIDTIVFNPADGILTITLESTATATVDLSAYTVLIIDGYQVKKGSGNTDLDDIEVGDYCVGWESDTYVAFKVTGLPYLSNRDFAINNSI
jgi:hypothetical protein